MELVQIETNVNIDQITRCCLIRQKRLKLYIHLIALIKGNFVKNKFFKESKGQIKLKISRNNFYNNSNSKQPKIYVKE